MHNYVLEQNLFNDQRKLKVTIVELRAINNLKIQCLELWDFCFVLFWVKYKPRKGLHRAQTRTFYRFIWLSGSRQNKTAPGF